MQKSLTTYSLIVVSIVALTLAYYGLRTRDIAIRGWEHSARMENERDEARKLPTHTHDVNVIEAYRNIWGFILQKIDFESDMEYALTLAAYIHKNIELGNKDTAGSVSLRLTRALMGEGESALCGDYSMFFRNVLMASGISARTVQLATSRFVNGSKKNQTHVTVDVLIDGQWLIIDPTFNATFSCSSDTALLGVEQAQQCVASGHELVPHQGAGTVAGRSVDEYPVPFEKHLEYYVLEETSVESAIISRKSFPDADWLERASKQHWR